jgi:putative hydrolase of the HAD superfamily
VRRPEVLLLDCGGTLSWPPFDRVRAMLSALRDVEMDEAHPYEGFYRSSHALEMYQREHGRLPAEDPIELQHWLYLVGFRLTGYEGVWDRQCTAELLRREGRMGAWDYTFPWVGAALARLSQAGLPLAVVSNSDGQVARLLERLGYAQYLDAIVDSHVEGFAKPDARLFHTALERLRRPDLLEQARECAAGQAPRPPVLHVGDHFRADYVGAREAGLHGYLIDPFNLYSDIPAEARVNNIAKLAQLLTADEA